MRFLVFTGGSLSELGKGTALCAIGALLQSYGFRVTVAKIDPYLNVDAGTLSPEEHGEVFVLEDGSEVDLDFGNYERELGLRLSAAHSITSGGVLSKVLQEEREGAYLGQTVRLAVHVMDAVLKRLRAAARLPLGGEEADVCLVEVGGAVGDWDAEIFLEALRKLRRDAEVKMAVCLMVPLVVWASEQKTKMAQDSVRALRGRGLPPDFLICRSERPMAPATRQKLARLSEVPAASIWESLQTSDLRQLPCHFQEQGVVEVLCTHLSLSFPSVAGPCLRRALANHSQCVCVGLVGKYGHENAYTSVRRALDHAAWQLGVDIEVELCRVGGCLDHSSQDAWQRFDAVCIPGGFGARGFDEKVRVAECCLSSGVPLLGLCLGFHAAVVAFCRRALGYSSATSEEFAPDAAEAAVVVKRPCSEMRKGAHAVTFAPGGQLQGLYAANGALERFRHRFEVKPELAPVLSDAGLLPARGCNGEVDAVELAVSRRFFVGTQYHPEFQSSEQRASPVFVGLLKAALEPRATRTRSRLEELD